MQDDGAKRHVRAVPPEPSGDVPVVTADDVVSRYLEDAAHYPGGRASAVATPRTPHEVGGLVASSTSVLAVGAQSSLTGGATPRGDLVVSTERLTHIVALGDHHVRVGAGVPLVTLQERLAGDTRYFPPVPTFLGATAGGVVATNAAGAATFKYGAVRQWVDALTVVLASGDLLSLERGELLVPAGDFFEIDTSLGVRRVPAPTYVMPEVPKCSAGYYSSARMDLIDLFIGSEGTLGIVTDVTFRVLSPPPSTVVAVIAARSDDEALDLVRALHDASIDTRRTRNPRGVDAAAIEMIDAPSIRVLREDGSDVRCGVLIPPDTAMLLIVQLEVPGGTTVERAYGEIASLEIDTPLAEFGRLISRADLLDRCEIVVAASQARRFEQILALREAVPAGVNQRIARAKATVSSDIAKLAGDMIVPFDRMDEMLTMFRRELDARGLDYAIWGHISDGNLHPNIIPRSVDEYRLGIDALLACGREVIRMGGSPLAEHGVGRNPLKQQLLRDLYGDEGIDQMRAVKRALDPDWKLAPGVIFPRGKSN